MIRNGDTYRTSLRDGRQVYLDGGIVGDVTRHPAYRNAIASAARLYEFQSQPDNAEP